MARFGKVDAVAREHYSPRLELLFHRRRDAFLRWAESIRSKHAGTSVGGCAHPVSEVAGPPPRRALPGMANTMSPSSTRGSLTLPNCGLVRAAAFWYTSVLNVIPELGSVTKPSLSRSAAPRMLRNKERNEDASEPSALRARY